MDKKSKILLAGLLIVGIVFLGAYSYKINKEGKEAISELTTSSEFVRGQVDKLNEFLKLDDTFSYSVNTAFQVALAQSLTSSATTIYISSSKLFNGEEFTPSYPVYLMINSGGSNAEITECWGMTTSTSANSFTSCNRGLSFSGNSSTSTISANQKAHAAGEKIAQTNVHYTLDQYFDRWANEIILGTTSTLRALHLNSSIIGFSATSSNGYIKNIGGYLGWSEPGAPNSTFLLANGSSGLTASSTLGISITASAVGIDFSGATNNYIDIGGWGHSINDLMASGTIYGRFSTSTWDGINIGISTTGQAFFSQATTTALAVTGSGTSTYTGTIQSNSAGTSTLPRLWTDQIGTVTGRGAVTSTGDFNVNGNINWTKQLGASNCEIGTVSTSTEEAGTITITHSLGLTPTDMEFTATCLGSGTACAAEAGISHGIATTADNDYVCWTSTVAAAADGSDCAGGFVAYTEVGGVGVYHRAALSAVSTSNFELTFSASDLTANTGMEIIYKICR